jgi:hypothetical protein
VTLQEVVTPADMLRFQGLLQLKLQKPRAANIVCIKLISPEDKMQVRACVRASKLSSPGPGYVRVGTQATHVVCMLSPVRGWLTTLCLLNGCFSGCHPRAQQGLGLRDPLSSTGAEKESPAGSCAPGLPWHGLQEMQDLHDGFSRVFSWLC